jgi:hypothetical protein
LVPRLVIELLIFGVPRHITADDQIAFRQLQRLRLLNLSREQPTDLFQLWRDHYRVRREAKAAALHARLARLWEERAALPSQQRAAVTERIAEIAREIAAGLC